MIVAHSMGGLVSRAAMSHSGLEHVERVVLLGTPNNGSFAPVLALRGVYAVVRKIARLSQSQTAESLAADVFSTFPSLYHLLPTAAGMRGPTFRCGLVAGGWAAAKRAAAVAGTRGAERAGARRRAVREHHRRGAGDGDSGDSQEWREFVYPVTRQGDGTVPVAFAELPGARTYYTTRCSQ